MLMNYRREMGFAKGNLLLRRKFENDSDRP
jgi:hypothetical protein